MAKKGREKNTQNKAKHTKLMNRKKNKLRKEKELRAERLKAIVKKANANASKQNESNNE
ncbi:hypothetical protein [uncultured Aquimarina sp.]|uniref:hypothetical protein n=1 Tax=uncultured Aquimarina sp. TaxID=575652 RepID=UPI00262737FE|nr:hypothetical protein [uncultured Aquimarina sp.]